MPSPPVLPSTARAAITGTYGATDWVAIFNYKVVETGTPTATDVLAIGLGANNGFAGQFAPNLSPNWQVLSTEVVYYPLAGGEIVATYTNPVSGTDTGIDLPASCAMVIGWGIASHYRGGHPRTYLSGCVTDRLLNQKSWTAATLSDFATASAAFITGQNTITSAHFSSVTIGTLRRFANGGSETKPRTYLNPPLFFPITAATPRSTVGSQRRRVER